MESTLTPAATTLLSHTLSKSLKTSTILSLLHFRRLVATRSPPFAARSLFSPRRLTSALPLSPSSSRFFPPHRCISSSSPSFSSGGFTGSGGLSGGGGGGGGDGSDSGVPKVGAVDDVPALSPDAIVLDVGGMTCGGCAATVKKILENQPQVSSATVNLATETAIVWPITEVTVVPNWRKELGEMLANHLTNCGFESNLRGQGDKEGETPL